MVEIITVYGTEWCWSSRRIRETLDREGIIYTWVDIDNDSKGREYVEKINNGNRSVPTIVFPGGDILVEPSDGEFQTRLLKCKKG